MLLSLRLFLFPLSSNRLWNAFVLKTKKIKKKKMFLPYRMYMFSNVSDCADENACTVYFFISPLLDETLVLMLRGGSQTTVVGHATAADSGMWCWKKGKVKLRIKTLQSFCTCSRCVAHWDLTETNRVQNGINMWAWIDAMSRGAGVTLTSIPAVREAVVPGQMLTF